MISTALFVFRSPALCRSRLRRGLPALAALLAGSGCGEALDELAGGASFTSIYESPEIQECGECHAPGAPGRTEDIEQSLNFSTQGSAYASLQGNASGMIGNFAACNGVPFIGPSADESLLVASLDEDVRADFEAASAPDCNADTISDQTLKIGAELPADLLQDLKDWIDAGAPNN